MNDLISDVYTAIGCALVILCNDMYIASRQLERTTRQADAAPRYDRPSDLRLGNTYSCGKLFVVSIFFSLSLVDDDRRISWIYIYYKCIVCVRMRKDSLVLEPFGSIGGGGSSGGRYMVSSASGGEKLKAERKKKL